LGGALSRLKTHWFSIVDSSKAELMEAAKSQINVRKFERQSILIFQTLTKKFSDIKPNHWQNTRNHTFLTRDDARKMPFFLM